MPIKEGLSTLCERLRAERLLVASEIETLQRLNEHVDTELTELVQLAWTSRQEQLTLSRLINSHPDATPLNCCRILARLEDALFLDGYQRLGPHDATIGQLLAALLLRPVAVADLLDHHDTHTATNVEVSRPILVRLVRFVPILWRFFHRDSKQSIAVVSAL